MDQSDFNVFALILLAVCAVCLVLIARGCFAIRDAIAAKQDVNKLPPAGQ
jgi:hypothetical protein